MFSLAFYLFVLNVVQLSNFFFQDLDRLRLFSEKYRSQKITN